MAATTFDVHHGAFELRPWEMIPQLVDTALHFTIASQYKYI